MLKKILVKLGYRRWRDIDYDCGWTLQACTWAGERRTVTYGRNIRSIRPSKKPRWKQVET